MSFAKDMKRTLSQESIANRISILLHQQPQMPVPRRKPYTRTNFSHHNNHRDYVSKRTSIRKTSLLNPVGGASFFSRRKDFRLLQHSRRTARGNRERCRTISGKYGVRLTPRELAFIQEGKELLYDFSSPYKDIDIVESNISSEIRYSALTPTCKFTFEDKHGWQPSKALLGECRGVLRRIERKREARRNVAREDAREKAREKARGNVKAHQTLPRLQLRPLDTVDDWYWA
jgi:hypothetical protein